MRVCLYSVDLVIGVCSGRHAVWACFQFEELRGSLGQPLLWYVYLVSFNMFVEGFGYCLPFCVDASFRPASYFSKQKVFENCQLRTYLFVI